MSQSGASCVLQRISPEVSHAINFHYSDPAVNIMKRAGGFTIGLAICGLAEGYQRIFIPVIQKMAKEENFRLVIYSGGPPGFMAEKMPHTASVFRYIDRGQLDALIMASGNINIFLQDSEWKQFYSRYMSIPMISIGIQIENIPSILIDNKTGIKEAVRHLAEEHGRKRIAFIKGPDNNPEAIERLDGFLEEMEFLNIPVNRNWIIRGGFWEKFGHDAVNIIWDRDGKKPEALIACNDDMAIGACLELERRGISVPDEVAVIGFDDVIEARNQAIPISTIHFPIFEQAELAGRLALDLLKGNRVPALTVLPVRSVHRDSCGCVSRNSINKILDSVKGKPLIHLQSEMENSFIRKEQIRKFLEINKGGTSSSKMDTINRYQGFFQELLSEPDKCFETVSLWKDFLFKAEYLYKGMEDDTISFSLMKNVFLETAFSSTSHYWCEEQHYSILLGYEMSALDSVFDFESVFQILENDLPLFHVKELFLFLFQKPLVRDFPDYSLIESEEIELVFNFKDEKSHEIKSSSRIFNIPEHILPESLLNKSGSYVLQTLHSGKDLYGYMIMSMTASNDKYYNSLAGKLSSVLKSIGLYRSLKESIEEKQELILELKESENRYYSIVEYLPFPLFEVDCFGTFIFANTAFKRMTGLSNIIENSRSDYFKDYFGEKSWESIVRLFHTNPEDIPLQPLKFEKRKDKEMTFLARIQMVGGLKARITLIEVNASWPLLTNIHEEISRKYLLNNRESEILPLLIKGYHSKEIAEKINLSGISIRKYFSSIYSKLNVHNRKELLILLESISKG